ncbi:hypothetical protein T05_4066 [Trichinella murrelli]|uniref:Uncharacterized protein n=1 Tax=Trichinella murrelli TaxID=144512 RepID=A0A0V0UCY5_9BILA|nr:hypothetical protein T05_4066 [Trichinella murrelli]
MPRRLLEIRLVAPELLSIRTCVHVERCSASEPTILSYATDTDNHGELTTQRVDEVPAGIHRKDHFENCRADEHMAYID